MDQKKHAVEVEKRLAKEEEKYEVLYERYMSIKALKIAGKRGILLGGWAGLTAEVLDTATEEGKALKDYAAANIFELPSCPHDWLFARCAAVVHHGGAGTAVDNDAVSLMRHAAAVRQQTILGRMLPDAPEACVVR